MPSGITVSYSELDAYRQCPHKHDLSFLQRWTRDTKSPALQKGSLWHLVMEAHYNVIRVAQLSDSFDALTVKAAAAEAVERILEDCPDAELADLIGWMYRGYVEHYGIDEDWRILGVEHRAEFWLPSPSGARSRFKLSMTLDLLVEWKGRLLVVDHKSCKNLPSETELDLDDQFGLYTWGMQRGGRKVFAAVHSAARTHRNVSKPQELEDRFRRRMTYRTPAELDRIALDAYWTARNAYGPNEAERNVNSDTCRWRCDFTDACLHGRKTTAEQEQDFLRSAGYVQAPDEAYPYPIRTGRKA